VRVLILGGTKFLGVHLTQALLARGHEVTHFNRGLTSASGLPGARTVTGDRTRGFGSLGAERFDAVLDTSGYLPHVVERSARFFAARAQRYVFVSTVSVYDLSNEAPNEDARVCALPADAPRTEVRDESYGPLKALCEAVVCSTYRRRATILRPGLIVGPLDPTDRFTYWPLRFARGGDVLVPAPPQRPVQFVDARDVAEFAVGLVERECGGVYNVTSAAGTVTMGSVVAACADAARVGYRLREADDAFLEAHGVGPWIELPLWVPRSVGVPGLMNVDVRRALAAGLRIRPLEQTVRDTLDWARARPRTYRPKAGLSEQREAELLAARL